MLSKAKLEENGSNLAVVLKKLLANPEKSKSLIRMTKYLLPFVKNVTVEKSLNKSLQFSINESHNEAVNLPNFLLSDGTVTVMATLVALAYEENKVAIFEEPERGIHPQLISKMMGLFYSITAETGKKQVIITTHNPEWLNHAKVEDILIFERNQQGMCEISRIKDREGVKSYLEDDLRIDTLFVNDLLHN
jgi:predicted ATPase